MKRIGVLTSGGDSPGMNAGVRAVGCIPSSSLFKLSLEELEGPTAYPGQAALGSASQAQVAFGQRFVQHWTVSAERRREIGMAAKAAGSKLHMASSKADIIEQAHFSSSSGKL